MRVMKALKDYVEGFLQQSREIKKVERDSVLDRLKGIVGEEWATNDPAILVAYANDPFPLTDLQMPRYVVLPRVSEEIIKIVELCRELGIPYVVRGNGGSVYGAVFTEGIVMDTNRMKDIEIDRENWTVTVGAGVTSFDLQQEAHRHGFRVNVAEPAATVCGNLVCTGIFSTWSSAYGIGADNLINAEFVDREGNIFHLNEKTAPNVYAFQKGVIPAPGICTQAVIPMYPDTGDEEGVFIPFAAFDQAVSFARNLSVRRIGTAIGVLGNHYVSTFMSPSADLANKARKTLEETLGIRYTVFVIGDRYARGAIKGMTPVVIDEKTLRMLILGLPRLFEKEWSDLVENFECTQYPYEILCREELHPILEAVLRPSPETITSLVDEDLRDFYVRLYSRPEMTSMVWLNSFRIVSSRMGRHKHVLAFLAYVPLDQMELIKRIISKWEKVADANGLENHFGFLTPMDFGKRGVLEYDYYLDHTKESDRSSAKKAMTEIEPFLDELSRESRGVMSMKYIFCQGCSRKENYLYL
jgi:hypothetical protein